jgi:uncharacterized protein YkwD
MPARHGLRVPVATFFLLASLLLLPRLIVAGSPLLQNGGFEGDFHSQPGIAGEVADGWVAYNEAGNPTYLATSTFANGGWVEKIEGSDSLIILAENLYPEGRPFTAVLYQHVNGLTPGTAYSASGWFLSMWGGSAGDDPPDPYAIGKKIGIDPTGGTDPTAPTVIWSAERWEDKSWVNPTVATRVSGTTLTVFLRVQSKWQQSANQAIVDGIRLEEAPVAAIDSISSPITTSFAVRWSGTMPSGLKSLGNFALFYDVEVQDDNGPWQTWLAKTRDTSGIYDGMSGHKYEFRVRPYAIQPKGEPPHYWPPSTFVGPVSESVSVALDGAPPQSWVNPLPPVQKAAPFVVSWSGQDDASGVATYTVQYRVGSGNWRDWLTDVTTTTAIFGENDQPTALIAGQRYDFRCRAVDRVGHSETYPATPDATTTLVTFLISGAVRDLRDQAVAGAYVRISPTLPSIAETTTDALGRYVLGVMASGTYSISITAAHAGFGTASPRPATIDGDRTGFDLFLPPAADAVSNGSFETGDLSAWQSDGAAIDSRAFTGKWAARLGLGSAAYLSQTVTISPGLTRPTLSFVYRPAGPATISDSLRLRIAGAEQVIPLTAANWTHHYVALNLPGDTGQTTSLEFVFEPGGTSGFGVLVDDVWLGDAPPPPQYLFLPMIKRFENNQSPTGTPSPTATAATVTPSPTTAATMTPSPTATATATPSPTTTATVTPSATGTMTPSATATATATSSATGTMTASPTATATATPSATPTPTATPDWLTYVNSYRALAALYPLTETVSWSLGAQNHARYMVENDYIGHDEDPANPWYTSEGQQAAQNGDVMVHSSLSTTDMYAIDLWMRGPFHAVGIIDPALSTTGFGSYRRDTGLYKMGAVLDVIRGLGTIPVTVTFPIYYPADGVLMPLLAYTGGETPDPLSSCPGYTPYTGPPIILQIGDGSQVPNVTGYSFWHAGASLEVCEFDETNYTNPVYTSYGRSVLDARDAIVLMPRYPLTAGETYSVTVTNNADTYTWSFTVSGDAH